MPKGKEKPGNNAEQAPKVRLAEHETVRPTLDTVLTPLKNNLLSAKELDELCDWLNAHRNSALAQDIEKNGLVCFGKPVGKGAPCVNFNGARFGRFSHWLVHAWHSDYRAACRD